MWTAPSSARKTDDKAISYPGDIRRWLADMTTEQRLQLHEDNLVQSQVLYGQEVQCIETDGEWVHVYVPVQPTRKKEEGYPAWVPKAQLVDASQTMSNVGSIECAETPVAIVKQPTAWLYAEGENEPVSPNIVNHSPTKIKHLEVSFQTRLPLIAEEADWVKVDTPHGERWVQRQDVDTYAPGERPRVRSSDLVQLAQMFLGLPYLWGGMSGFGFDCSGFMYTLHRASGLNIPRDASDQANSGVPVPHEQLQPGDLLFFAYEEGKGRVHHVGMYVGEGRMIHAPKTGKSIEVIPLVGTIYEREHCASRRYIHHDVTS
nr:C40 family peptidase [Caldalkalibacillus salinus]